MTFKPIKIDTRANRKRFTETKKATGRTREASGGKAYSNRTYRRRFDFEVGYFVKSPCKGCEIRHAFPGCLESCEILDEIHSLLTESMSCSRRG